MIRSPKAVLTDVHLYRPLLVRWYRRVSANEIYNFEVYYHENVENSIRDLMRLSKSQLEYFTLHQDYDSVRAASIKTFIANEQLNLQRHIVDRTLSILKQAQVYEEINRQNFLKNILEQAANEIDKQLQGEGANKIQRQMLDSAIEGLRKGFMDYSNDPILPLVQGVVQREVQKIQSLSPEEQGKLVSLTEYQVQSIRDTDKKAKEDFLRTEPKGLDGGLKTNDSVKKILAGWGQ